MEKTIPTHPATYPPATPIAPVLASESRRPAPLQLTNSDPARALAAIKAKRAEWATIAANPATQLRQQWADEAWMRAHLRAASVSVADDREPASVRRLRKKLAQAGISVTEAQEAVGLTLCKFLRVNPRLPLWAALALVLEATGRFTSLPS